MSGAFEAAAGAFAVVGVADVVVRTVRELYTFLYDVADAPEAINRLRELIEATFHLYEASQRCWNDLKSHCVSAATANANSSLESAVRALNRELQSLKALTSRFKGKKSWDRVKYVLSEGKITKALASLERTKTLLASALTLACRTLTALGDKQIELVVQDGFQRAGLQAEHIHQAVIAKLDVQHQDVMSLQRDQQKALMLMLDTHGTVQDAHHHHERQTVAALHRSQADMRCRQDLAIRVMKRQQKQTTTMLRDIQGASTNTATTTKEMITKLDDLAADMKLALSTRAVTPRIADSGREFMFIGEHADKILQYLLPLEDELDHAIDYLVYEHGEEISKDHAEWLRSEFHRMIDSGTQERAARCVDSTATAVDQWYYAENTIGFLKNRSRNRRASQPVTASVPDKDFGILANRWPGKSKRSGRRWTVPTASGDVHITMPQARTRTSSDNGLEELDLSYTTTQGRAHMKIQARFLRELRYAAAPRLCTQLNAFVLVNVLDKWRVYKELFQHGDLNDIDKALREGIVSPFHVSQDDMNMVIWHATRYLRVDILDYLDTQGIGQRVLNRDIDIGRSHYFFKKVNMQDDNNYFAFSDKAIRGSIEPTALATQMALQWLMDPHLAQESEPPWCGLLMILDYLKRESADEVQLKRLSECYSSKEWRLFLDSVPQLLQILIDGGASVTEMNADGLKMTAHFFVLDCASFYNQDISIRILGILIEHGASGSDADRWGLTPSMYARWFNQWSSWCDALEHTGRHIEDVVNAEGKEWLLRDDWYRVWIELRCFWWEDIQEMVNTESSVTTRDHDPIGEQ